MLIILLPAILKSWAAIFYDDTVVGYIYITLGLSVVIFLKLAFGLYRYYEMFGV